MKGVKVFSSASRPTVIVSRPPWPPLASTTFSSKPSNVHGGRRHPASTESRCRFVSPSCASTAMSASRRPNKAISQGESIYVIDPSRCTECVGITMNHIA